ncbi:glycoside hydrolase family 88 protein [Lentisphaerota bacterium WC36G]|nr:glycoside hydrolase family 88 protein [Lentisphaerae bacterium WC36]
MKKTLTTMFLSSAIICSSLSTTFAHNCQTSDDVKRINKLLKEAYPGQNVNLSSADFAKKQIISVADYQIKRLDKQAKRLKHRDWTLAPFFRGLASSYRVTNDKKYLNLMEKIAKDANYQLGNSKGFADDHAVVQLYVELALLTGKQHYIEQAKKDFSHQIKVMPKYSFRYKYNRHRWNWCDALFMAPPAWAGVSKVSGDNSYMNHMVNEFKTCTDLLYSKKYNLYYRDERFLGRTSNNGKPIFWGRGNGWVYAGLASVMKWLPEGHNSKPYFEKIFKDMTRTLVLIQNRDNGLWAMNLIDQKDFPFYETSGSAFFCYGLFWGINNGLLDANRYLPYAIKAWNGLNSKVTAQGKVTHVQPVGASPDHFNPNDTEIYGVGGYLMAAEEYHKFISNEAKLKKITGSCYSRLVPERLDDYAWENDYIAFRVYGPSAAKTNVGNGFDCFLKRVSYPIINKLYSQAKEGKSYHKDYGEGYDPYKVGTSFGAGSMGLRDPEDNSRKVYYGTVFKKAETIVANGFITKFKLFYDWNYNNQKLIEEKVITLHSGERLFKVESTFKNAKTNNVIANLPVVIGISLHDKYWVDRYNNKTDGVYMVGESFDGGFEVGVKIKPEKIKYSYYLRGAKNKFTGHTFLNANTDKNGKISYYAGYAWEKQAGFTNSDFATYLELFQLD